MCTDLRKFIDGPSSYLTLPQELKSAIEAITYIAEALQAEKDYEAVSFIYFFLLHFCLFIQHPFSSIFLMPFAFCFLFFLPVILFNPPADPSSRSTRPSNRHPAEGGLAVRGHGGGQDVPLDLCYLYHCGHLGHLCGCQLQPHTQEPILIPVNPFNFYLVH